MIYIYIYVYIIYIYILLTHSLNLKLIELFKETILMLHQQSIKLAGLFILV